MRRLISFVASFYPRGWREEFGDEFDAVLEDVGPRWQVMRNVLWGAIEMQLSSQRDWVKTAVVTAVLGAVVALGVSFTRAPRYESSAAVTVTPQADPVRGTSADVLEERAITRLNAMKAELLSRTNLSVIINAPSLELYKKELRNMPLVDVVEQMRRDIRIQEVPSGDIGLAPIRLNISFSYPDQEKAQAVVRTLVSKLVEINYNELKTRTIAYREFWMDMKAYDHPADAPAPPPGEVVWSVAPASLPLRSSGPNRVFYVAGGLCGGFLFALTLLTLRRSSGMRKLGLFAMAGGLLAGAASFVIPDRYTSSADMIVEPALFTEDPMATPPGISVTDFLRQTEPAALSDERLMRIIQDPRLRLYSEEIGRKPINGIVKEMRDNLLISVLRPTRGAAAAFRISFTYPDRYKAQQTVIAMMNSFDELNARRQHDAALHGSIRQRAIIQRKIGEVLDVLDVPDLPQTPVSPHRGQIVLVGLGIGFVLGATVLWLRSASDSTLRIS